MTDKGQIHSFGDLGSLRDKRRSMRNILMDCGFEPPVEEFLKKDPRGEEYGYFAVSITDDKAFALKKCSQRGNLEWSCTFQTQEHFQAWAEDNT